MEQRPMTTATSAPAVSVRPRAFQLTTASTAEIIPFREYRFLQVLCGLFTIVWVLSAIKPIMVEDWALENGLVFLFVGILTATYRRLQFSQLSYLLIFVYLCLHEWGAHYKYAIVPFGEWIRQVMHTTRNDYDRVVHFAFGLLMAYPQREMLLRKTGLRREWAPWVTVLVMLGYGAAYEIIEAIAAAELSPDAGDAFLGLQGDPWDTHKDMFMALAGATIAMLLTAVLSRRRWSSRSALSAR
jgi:putative membrane protein